MKHLRIIVAPFLALAALSASAQSTNAGFFNDGYMFRHTINPAVANRQSYFAMPVLGNVNVGMRGTIGVGDLVYYDHGKTVTFMHPSVDTEQAVRPFKRDVRIEQDLRLDLLSMGFAGKRGRGYTTIEAGVRQRLSLALPGQLFRMAKEGPANQTYDFSNINAHADAFVEVALGHSHKIGDDFAVGAKAKLLLGFANVDATADGTQLTLGEDEWTATTNAEVQASVKSLKYTTTTTDRGPKGHKVPHTYVDGVDYDKLFGLNGIGAAIDLGVTGTIAEDWKVGLALVDLGVIKWNNNMVASTCGPHSFTTDAFTFSADDDADNSFENEFENLGSAVADLYELQNLGDQGGRTTSLGATLNASVEYALPFYHRLSFGLLSTTRLQGERTWNEERLSVNLAPTKWFALSVSGGYGTFGSSFGGMLSFHPKGFSLYAGMDCLGGPYDKNGIPLGRAVQANFGLVFPF